MKKILLIVQLLVIVFFVNAQNVGIGITTPTARLHVKDSAVLFSAAGDLPATPGLPPVQGPGRRMMWYPNKAAFRVGYVNGTQWDQNNIGNYSFAAGRITTASGNAATAFGYGANATGIAATAFGRETLATGDYSTATGFGSEANGFLSNATGAYSFATGDYSMALGNSATASGNYAVAIGENINAKATYETVLGRWNTDYIPAATTTDRLFSIGNGTAALARSDALTILKNGKVGIGISIPGFPLTFTGTLGDKISLWTDGTATHYGFGIQSSLLQMFAKTSLDDIGFGYGSSSSFNEAMRIKGNGNVGIGVNPLARLSVSANGIQLTGSAASNTFRTLAGTLGSTAGDELSLANIGFASTNNSSLGIRAYRTSTGSDWTTTALLLEHDVDNTTRVNSTYLALGANGNIGIGTVTPNAPLGFAASLGKKITLYPGATGDVGMAVQGNLFQIYADNPSADIAMGYDQAGTMTERFRVKGNGNIGVGTNNPLTKLHVFNGSSGNGSPFSPLVVESNSNTYINLLSPNANETSILFGKADNAASGGIIYNNSSNPNGFDFRVNGNQTVASLKNNGNLGLGAGVFGSRLTLAQSVSNNYAIWLYLLNSFGNGEYHWKMRIGPNPDYRLYFTSITADVSYIDANTGFYTNISDRKFKKDIESLPSVLPKMMQLNPVSYRMKNQLTNDMTFGFIAQELQKVFPDAVKTFDNKGTLGISYTHLIPLTVAAIQEQQKTIEKQQQQIDELKKLVDKLIKQ